MYREARGLCQQIINCPYFLNSPCGLRMFESRISKQQHNLACMVDIRNSNQVLVRKPEGSEPHGRHKFCLKEVGCEAVEWLHLAQNRVQWWAFVNL